jgi:hypothetical protein
LRRARGDLVHLTKAREKAFLVQPVPLSYSADGVLRFGQTVMVGTGAGADARYLATNIFMPMAPNRTRVTAGAGAAATARNTFVLGRGGRPRAPGVPEDGVLRFGDGVTLACNPSLLVDAVSGVAGLPHYLFSTRGNNLLGTARKGKQEVALSPGGGADAEWLVMPADGERLVREGQPVSAGDAVSLVHAMSNVLLAGAPGDTYPTEFGAELDVHCATHRGTGVLAVGASGELPVVPSQAANIWRFALAADAAAAEDRRGIRAMDAGALLERSRRQVAAAAGPHGLRSLGVAFAALDPRDTGRVPAEGLKWALYEHGVRLQEAEAAMLLAALSERGSVARVPFLAALGVPPELPPHVAAAVAEAHAHLAAGAGAVPVGALKAAFDGKFDPRVGAGARTKAEAKAEFACQWPAHGRSGAVTVVDLCDYYRDVLPMLPEGADAEALVANTWHVPGKGSWLRPKGLRVLMTFHKGSTTETTLPEAEHLDHTDQALLTSLCEAQGFGGIARVKVLRLVDAED